MNRVCKITRKSRKKIHIMTTEKYDGMSVNSRLELIQALIPLGLRAVEDELLREVEDIAGTRYSRGPHARYGTNPGSVVLAGQRVAIDIPRVRDIRRGTEIPLTGYRRLHEGFPLEEAALTRVLRGLSCRDYREAAMAVPEAFGLSASNVSRQFVRASGRRLKDLMERELSSYDIVAILIDGKSFSQDDLIVAVGVPMEGPRIILGFIEAATENAQITGHFLQQLLDRGLNIDEGVLVVVDGSKGLIAAIRKVFADKALIQRCQWHKRENVVAYVSKTEQPFLRRRLQHAYERPTYDEAMRDLMAIHKDMEGRNLSAAASLEEGLEETLTLHRLGLFPLLGTSLKTTNGIETINALIEQRCGKVDYWKSSSQRQRWLAAALLDIEPRLRRIRGHQHLWKLREALKKELNIVNNEMRKAA